MENSALREPGEELNSRLERHKTSKYWELDWNKNIMINRFSKGKRILFIDSHWYVPRENMLICSYSLLRRNSIVRVLYQNAGKNLPLIVRAQPRRYACFGSKPTYKKLINTKIRQNKLRVEERPKPRRYKIWIGSHAPAELKDKLEWSIGKTLWLLV